ncbi:MAG: hypothetical protein QOJ63_1829 [Solirubrobacteraceae bacterium]|nr:hypothetical protein [Solirubrobacteraceae bacterium]
MARTQHTQRWTDAHVRRLFWRAGFGATSEEARYWAARSRTDTVDWLLRGGSGPPRPAFPKPSLGGRPLDPVNEYGQDVLWWLDKMIRTPRPLIEKMTLFWHDHFATLDQDRPLQLAQNKMLRRNALGSFRRLLSDVTKDPAMLLFLSLANSTKEQPNENYARELMELFTLGSGYTETDIREASRALTGFRSKRRGDGTVAVLYDAKAHDATTKKLFGQRGNFDYRDVLDLCIDHPPHAPFLVSKLWDYFVGTPIEPSARARLAGVYRGQGHQIAPVVREILEHPALYGGLGAPDVVKSPVVYVVGSLRACGEGIASREWVDLLEGMGQLPFSPPSVAGWEWGTAWLSSNTMHMRFDVANALLEGRRRVRDGGARKDDTPAEAVARARVAVDRPWTSAATDAQLLKLATRLLTGAPPSERQQRADMCQRVLRHLLLAGPDAQVH